MNNKVLGTSIEDAQVDVQVVDVAPDPRRVTVTITRSEPTFLAKVLNVNTVDTKVIGVAEVGRNSKLVETGTSFLGQVIRHLHINVIRRNRFRPRPTGVYDLYQFLRDVDAESVGPAVLEPLGELVARIVVENVDVEFSLLGQAGERQIAAAEVSDRWI